jgi:hypothetical protein
MPDAFRLLRFLRSLKSRAELLMFFRLAFWAGYFRIMKRFVPLPILVRRAIPISKPHRLSLSPDRIAELGALAARAVRAGRDANCLERSLAIYRQLIRSGGKPALAVGFKRDLHVTGHAWVVVGGEPLGEWERISIAHPAVSFDETGRVGTVDPVASLPQATMLS